MVRWKKFCIHTSGISAKVGKVPKGHAYKELEGRDVSHTLS